MFGLSYKDVMAFTSLPKLVPIGSPRVSAEEITRNMLTEVLQSEPVKKLLAKPNILIKAVSFTPNEKPSPNGQSRPSVIKTSTNNHAKKRSHTGAMKNEDAHLLPSKKNGKSEIILTPLPRQLKPCGHYESCEKIVCDVQIQQYVDYEGSSPLLARTIDESEITAVVLKHCSDPRCDALSIDHNFCRRASVRLCRIDKSNVCDVCGAVLKTRKSRLHHQNCRRPERYSHDDVDVDLVRRRRMREREIQLTEALKLRRNDYSDPILGPIKAIEVLKKNSELIVIPKAPTPPPPPLVVQPPAIAPQPTPMITLQAAHPSAVPIVLPPQPIVRPKILLNPVRVATATKVIQPSVVAIEPASKAAPANNKFIVSTIPQGTSTASGVVSYPVMLSDWVSSQPVEYVQPEPVLMPVRVVPIASLKSEPSLLHQKQGVPKFCIIADNSVPPQSFVNLPAFSTIQPLSNVTGIHTVQTVTPAAPPAEPPQTTEPEAAEKPANKPPAASAKIKKGAVKKKKGKTSEKRNSSNKRNAKRVNAEPGETDATAVNVTVPSRKKKYIKKPYQCKYCAKKFLTDWYYRMHVARHKIKSKLICDVCNKAFSNNYDLKNHMADKHTEKFEFIMDEKDLEQVTLYVACDNCENVFDSVAEMEAHNCKGVMMTDDSKEESNGDIIVPPFYGNGECNSEEVEKENGVCGRGIVEPSKKLKNDEQSVVINNKYSSRRKTRHSARDECHELSSNSVIKINPHNNKCQDYEGELVIDEDRLDDSF